MQHQHHNLW